MSDISLLKRIEEYDKEHCFQYERRLQTYEEDKKIHGWSDEDIQNIKLDDFEFLPITTKKEKQEATDFIQRYEWLQNVAGFPTHWFVATYRGLIGGVIIMGMPNAFSKMMGDDTKEIERLIMRGASASWTPKNLGSKFLMWCIRWMVNNTQYRLFDCYSDPLAKERGKIYQSLNFYYLGQKSGTTVRCINPYDSNKVISDRQFRSRSFYRRYMRDLGIEEQDGWISGDTIHWENIPDDIEKKLRDYSKEMFKNAKKIKFPNKRKWAFVLGKDKRETKQLRKRFLELNKIYKYPDD